MTEDKPNRNLSLLLKIATEKQFDFEILKTVYDSADQTREEVRKAILDIKMDTESIRKFQSISVNEEDLFESASKDALVNLYNVFEIIASEKCMYVVLGTGAIGYKSKFLGGLKNLKECSKFSELEENRRISIQKTIMEKTIPLIRWLREIFNKDLEPNAIKDEILNNLSIKQFEILPAFMIKIFSCVFPDVFAPIFELNDLNEYLKFLTLNGPYTYEKSKSLKARLKLAYDIREKANEVFHDHTFIILNSSRLVNFLYLYSKFSKDPKDSDKLKNRLHDIGYNSYPKDEQAVLGLFLLMVNKGYFARTEFPLFSDLEFIFIGTKFPDIIAKYANELILIELEYESNKYNHQKDEIILPGEIIYVVCWEKIGIITGGTKKREIISLKDLLLK